MSHIPPEPRSRSIPESSHRSGSMRLGSEALAPARRARALLVVLGALAILLGVFFAAVPANAFQTSINSLQLLHAAGIFAAGVAFSVLGVMVRAGTRRPAVAAIVVAVLASAYLVMIAVAEVRNGKYFVEYSMPMTFIVVLLAALLLAIRWLWQAALIAPKLAAARRRPDSAAPPSRPTP